VPVLAATAAAIAGVEMTAASADHHGALVDVSFILSTLMSAMSFTSPP